MIKSSIDKDKILKYYFLFPIVSTIISLLVLTASFIAILNKFEKDQIKRKTEQLIKTNKILIKNHAVELSNDIDNQILLAKKITKRELKTKVYLAYRALNFLCKSNLEKSKKLEISLGILRTINSDKDEYFFAYDRKSGVVKLHGIKKLIGKNTKYLKTKSGISPYERNEKILKNSKEEGYFKVYFQKPNVKGKRFEKIDFIKYIKCLNLVIGTGEYVDKVIGKLKKNILERVMLRKYDKDKYFVIFNTKGILLAHPYLKDKIGKNILNIKDKTGKYFIKEIINLLKHQQGAFVTYYWLNPTTNKVEKKISYAVLNKKLNWIILTGSNLLDLNDIIEVVQGKMIQSYKDVYITTALILVIYLFLIAIVLWFISKYLNAIFIKYDNLLKEKKEEAEYRATHDALTKIANRASFDEVIKVEFEKALRYKRDLSVAIMDIDNFKQINDTFGHQVGDIILQNLASFCQKYIRKSDFFARWGGEEFVFVFDETEAKTAVKICEKLKNSIFADENLQKIATFTVSIGVSELRENDTIESLIKRVDEALYKAKNSGRNKVIYL